MTPTPALVTVNYDDTVEVALRRCITSGHTRLLVIEDDNPDRVRGVVHSNRLAQALMGEGPDAPIAPLVREALIMPETKPLDDLLTDLRSQRASLAVIADEFGRTAGIVTIEDIIEEIVGEIVDETDPLLSSVRQLVNGDWFVRGHVSLGDLDDVGISLPVESDAYTTVGGYVFGQLGRLPKRGDQITANGYLIRVESVRENRVEAVRIHPHGRSPTPSRGLAAERDLSARAPTLGAVWSARFTESQLETLKELIRIQGEVGSELEGALEAMELARWDDLPEAELPWPQVSEQAERQGISEADVIWDMAGRKKEPAFPLVKKPRKQAARAPKRARTARRSGYVVVVEAGAGLPAQAPARRPAA